MALLRSKPLRSKSDKAVARDRVLSKVKPVLLKRAAYRPECCYATDGRLEHHHVFGRSGLGAWNDSAECGAVLCPGHHRIVTDEMDPELKAQLQMVAVSRLRQRLWDETGKEARGGAFDKLDYPAQAREVVAQLEAAGIEP